MTQSEQLIENTGETLYSIHAAWSESYFKVGQENPGILTITSTKPSSSIILQKGDQILLETPGDPNWKFSTPASGQWSAKMDSKGSNSICFLTYNGSDKIKVPSLSLYFYNTREFENFKDGQPLEVNLTISVPGKTNARDIKVALLDTNDHRISTIGQIPINTVEPDRPLVAFALNPAAILLTGAGAIGFPNAISCALLNQSGSTLDSASLSLSLSAQNAQGHPVDITQSLSGVKVTGDLHWTPGSNSNTWTADLKENLPDNTDLNIKIINLVLKNTEINTLQANFTIKGVEKQPYHTMARFQAYGPYTLSLSLDQSQSDANYYRFQEERDNKGTYDIHPLNQSLDKPPLLAQLRDSDDNVVYPPIAGWFSWSKTKHYFPSNYNLKEGDNELYYLLSGIKPNTYQPLASSTAILKFTEYDIQAKGFQQAYLDPKSKNTQYADVMPSGAIIMWSGTDLPPGWVYCDGKQYSTLSGRTITAPDLQDKFIMGAGGTEKVNASSGPDAHDHLLTISNDFETKKDDGTHAHSFPSTWDNYEYSCGSHNGIWPGHDGFNQNDTTQTDGAHQHSITISFENISTGSQNVTSKNPNPTAGLRPNWYALCFIMKL